MRLAAALVVSTLAFGAIGAAPAPRTYTGIVTDTMCKLNHAHMGVTPDTKCVLLCVHSGQQYKFALAVGQNVYTLSDQQTPEEYAGLKVKVTGSLYTKTNILKLDRMEAAR
jgi:hypothetical protein